MSTINQEDAEFVDKEADALFYSDCTLAQAVISGIKYERSEIAKIIDAARPTHERNSSFIMRDIQLRVKGGAA